MTRPDGDYIIMVVLASPWALPVALLIVFGTLRYFGFIESYK